MLPLALSAGCGDGSLGAVPQGTDTDAGSPGGGASGGSSSSVGTTAGSGSASSGSGGGSSTGSAPVVREVDLLLVLDNTGDTLLQQNILRDGMGELIAALDGAAEPVDYRIAITTTDSDNPACTGTTPENGAFVGTACTQRLDDVGPATCDSACNLDGLVLAEPWIDVSNADGASNLPLGLTANEALSCLLPQGGGGCRFPQQLESMHLAIVRSLSPGDPAFGFRRADALLAVVLVTTAADCSFQPGQESVFSGAGDRALWPDPDSETPDPGLCWNAGVACSGGPGVYDDCISVNRASDGLPTPDPNQAVLHPVSRYTDLLEGEGAYVAAVTGVQGDGSIVYADSPDPELQTALGIGPGCSSAAVTAAPPVRIRTVVEQLGGDLVSACDESYGPALGSIGRAIVDRLP